MAPQSEFVGIVLIIDFIEILLKNRRERKTQVTGSPRQGLNMHGPYAFKRELSASPHELRFVCSAS